MGLKISDILGLSRRGKAAPRGIGEVETALSRLADERKDAREALAQAMRTREELLLEDDSDKKIDDLDSASDRLRLTLERCDKLEPLLRAELQSLHDDAKRRRWQNLSERYDAEARAFAGAFRATLEKWQSLVAIRGEAQNSGFAAEAGALIVPPYTLAPELLDRFEADLDRQRDFATRKSRPAPLAVVAAAEPAPAIKKTPPPRPPAPARKTVPAPAPEFKPFTPTPDAEGLYKVVFLKKGYELEDGRKPSVGDVIALEKEQAYAVVRATVGEFEGAA